MAEAGAQPAARQGGRGDRRPRRDGDKKAGGARRPYKRRELPPGYEVEVLPEPEEVARPDVEAQRARVGAVEAEIEAAKAERGKLQALIGTRGKRSHGVTSEAKEARDRLNEIRGELQRLKEERSALTARMKAASETAKSKFEASKALRGDLRFTSVEKIDDRVDDLRHKHSTESMSLQAEKALMKEITDLRSQRSKVAEYDAIMQAVSAARDEARAAREAVSPRLKELDAEMDAVRQRMDAQWQIVKAHEAKRDEQRADLPALIEQRDAANAKVEELFAKRREVREANQAQWDAFKAYSSKVWEVREAQKALDKVGWDKYYADMRAAKEEEAKAAERAAEEEAKKHHPWEPEIEAVQVLINYLRPLIAQPTLDFEPILPPGVAPSAGAPMPAGQQVSLTTFLKSQSSEAVAANKPVDGGAAAAAPAQDFGKVRAYGKKTSGASKTEGEEFGSFMSMLGGPGKKGGKKGKATRQALPVGAAADEPTELVDTKVRLDMSMISLLAKHSVPALGAKRLELLANPPKPGKGGKKKAAAKADEAAVSAPPPGLGGDAVDEAPGSVSLGDSVKTPYGAGEVTEVRADGMVVVAMSDYAAVGYLNPSDVVLA
ncbi:unnamed protein product [Symbiodinium sp. KB8]|nr:unnamed protein product [Symbiodinium sp. KB8]